MKKLGNLKSQMADLEGRLKTAEQEAAAATLRASAAEAALATSAAQSSTAIQQLDHELKIEIADLRHELEAARTAEAAATKDANALRVSLAEAQKEAAQLASVQAQLAEMTAANASWQERCGHAEQAAASAASEASILRSSHANTAEDLTAVRAHLTTLQTQLIETTAAKSSWEERCVKLEASACAEISELQQSYTAVTDDLQTARAHVDSLQTQIAESSAEKAMWEERCMKAEQAATAIATQTNELSASQAQASEELNAARSQLAQVQAQLAEAIAAKTVLEARCTEAEQATAALGAEIDTLHIKSADDLAAARAQIATLETQLAASTETVNILEERCARAEKAAIAAAAEADAMHAAHATATQNYNAARNQLACLQAQVHEATASKALLEARCAKAEEAVAGAAAAVAEELCAANEQVAALEAQVQKVRASAASWEERCTRAEEAAVAAAAESDAMRAARATAVSDLHEMRARLENVQRQAEDFQRRFLAERLERRRLHEELQTLRGNIRVVCRAKPSLKPAVRTALSFPMNASIRVTASERRVSDFEFSSVLEPTASQEDVFEEVWPALRSCMDGHNVCIFAYGQTGSGKTHTLMGTGDNVGIAPRAVRALFDLARHEHEGPEADAAPTSSRKFAVSMLELYLDGVRDLLGDDQHKQLDVLALGPLTQEHIAAGLDRVPGRTWRPVDSPEAALVALDRGSSARAIASTPMNTRSSRSHVVLTLRVEDPSASSGPCSMLHLVDLAGSERVAKSEAEGQQLKEAQAINKSLAALGDVVSALQARSPHVPYRNSKLTCLLQDSLGGTSKVLLMCCVAPETESVNETLSTLLFAQRAAAVELGASSPTPNSSGGGSGPAAHRSSSPRRLSRGLSLKTPSPVVMKPTCATNGGGRTRN